MLYILATGSRHLLPGNEMTLFVKECLHDIFNKHDIRNLANVTVMHGDAHGFDNVFTTVARDVGIGAVRAFPARWDEVGRRAGPMRNQEMLKYAQDRQKEQSQVYLIGCSALGEKNAGTQNMVDIWMKARLDFEHWMYDRGANQATLIDWSERGRLL